MNAIINFLRSERGLFMALVIFLLASTPHTAMLFHNATRLNIGNTGHWIHGYGYSLICELVILMLALNRKAVAAKVYAVVSLACQILYFHRWDELISNPSSETIVDFIFSILASFMLSGSIWYFSELFVESLEATVSELRSQYSAELSEKDAKISQLESALSKSKLETESLKMALSEKEAKENRFDCPECKQTFATQNALNAHKRSHINEPVNS